MSGFLDAILAFPTVLFTIPLGVSLCYWVTVMVGGVGVDLFDGDMGGSLEGGAKAAGGMLEGGAKAAGGMLEGGAKATSGVLDGGIKATSGALDGGGLEAGGAEGVEVDGGGASFLDLLGFGRVPVTVSFTAVTFFSWLLSLAAAPPLHKALEGVVPSFLTSTGVGLLSLALGVVAGGLVVRPLRPLFTVHQAPRRNQLMGRVCTINSGRVDGRFGHANFEDGGAGILLNVFCDKANQLKRGDQAVILGYDPARQAYEVEPVDWLLPEEVQNLKDPTAAEALARARSRVR